MTPGKRVARWEDARRSSTGAIFVGLLPGWRFLEPRPPHVAAFTYASEAKAAVRAAVPCECADCQRAKPR